MIKTVHNSVQALFLLSYRLSFTMRQERAKTSACTQTVIANDKNDRANIKQTTKNKKKVNHFDR